MTDVASIARLNVLIEMFSECANARDLETLWRVAAGRLRWIMAFDRCTFVVTREEERVCWTASRLDERLGRVDLANLPEPEASLIKSVLGSGAPAGWPGGKMCIPLQAAGETIGAIFFVTETGTYTHRDVRLGHHAGQYLGSLISRMELEEETRRLSSRKDDLLALLSHELRNPLAPIVTAVAILRRRVGGEHGKELDIIDRQAQHLVRLVDDLLDAARLTRGKLTLRRAPVEIAPIVARAIEMVSPLLEEHRHSLEVDVPSFGLVVDGDEDRLAQVFSNLLSNAAHYTPAGGHIAIRAREEGEAVAIEVSDDGIGIAVEALSNIFDLFVQGTSAVSEQRGLGLGLVVVKQLTELHGGSVVVASEGDGRGTKFTVRLPGLPAGSIAAAASSAALLSPPHTECPQRVLLVDDNEDALALLSAFVEGAGHEVVVAHNGPDALAVLDRFHASVAVIDIGMPVMDGYELAARVRTGRGEEAPYLVALTGYGQAKDRARTGAAGFDEHLVKPVDLAHLLRVIDRGHAHSAAEGSPG